MRGKEDHRSKRLYVAGITPAYAGKRPSANNSDFTARDHPRVCGEKVSAFGNLVYCSGSPPRMREKDVVDIIFTPY